MTKIEEITMGELLTTSDETILLTEKINLLIKAHNEREEEKCCCGKEKLIGSADVEIGGICHRKNNPCYEYENHKPLSHFFKPESELIQSYIKEREILLERLKYCYRFDGIFEEEIKEITKRLQEIDKLILK